jgi:hypothetical protein
MEHASFTATAFFLGSYIFNTHIGTLAADFYLAQQLSWSQYKIWEDICAEWPSIQASQTCYTDQDQGRQAKGYNGINTCPFEESSSGDGLEQCYPSS